jgi:hypothetical protein
VSAILIARLAVAVLCSGALMFFRALSYGACERGRTFLPSALEVYSAKFNP